ncbi:MAG: 2-oxoacid:acceptor oxidoreductase family protein, partial [Aigarchaeota archaeon]|nr:2-oxoacid:acceptor oxidoreductase family protein [Aigarchaeota archaeon]
SLLIDPDLIKEAPRFLGKIFNIPANRTSEEELGSRLYTNMVMLGALTSITGVVTAEAVEKSIADYVGPSELEKNLKAFKLGLGLPAKTSTQ